MSLVVPGTARPSNLRLPLDRVSVLDSDMYRICDRIKEIDPRLYIVAVDGSKSANFVIMEECADGVDRMVTRVKELDARVLKSLRKMLSMPLDERMKELEREEEAARKRIEEEQFEEFYERMGRPMLTQLDHDGFIDGGRPVSYPKKGVKATKGIVGH